MKTTLFWLLLTLFIGLKLADVITWSWWWVFSPVWVPLVAAAGGVVWLLLLEERY